MGDGSGRFGDAVTMDDRLKGVGGVIDDWARRHGPGLALTETCGGERELRGGSGGAARTLAASGHQLKSSDGDGAERLNLHLKHTLVNCKL